MESFLRFTPKIIFIILRVFPVVVVFQERDCLVGYGSSGLLQERLMISSDAYSVMVAYIALFFAQNE